MVAHYFIIIVSAIFLLCIIGVISYHILSYPILSYQRVSCPWSIASHRNHSFFLLFLPSLFKICSSSGQYALPRHVVQLQGREHI
jgi:succinate dehydrogenase hydrophobic anchor subunit